MRRLTSFIFVFILLLTVFSGTVFAAEPEYTGDPGAHAWVLIDADSGKVLASKNMDEKIEPASTTKIMTLLLAIENGNLSDTVTISGHASRVSGSSCELREGAEINLKNLLTAMMMVSGNDAATAVAEHIGGTEDGFITMMNDKAKALGMTNTNFVTPHGKHDENHFTTAADMAILASAAMKNPTFMEIVDKASYTLPENNTQYDNTNHLMDGEDDAYYPYATGIKTGSTDEAGPCLVASASKDGTDLIVLLFNDEKDGGDDRWVSAKSLFDYGFNHYQSVKLSEVLKDTSPVQDTVENCSATDEKGGLLEFAMPSEDTYVTLGSDTASGLLDGSDSIEVEHTYNETVVTPLQAPIEKNEILGTVTYKSANTGEVLYSGPLVATRDVLQAGTESSVEGGTAVATLPPTIPEQLIKKSDHSGIWLWLLIPVVLIAFLVFRLLTVNKKRRKRYSTRKRPQYSYKIRR